MAGFVAAAEALWQLSSKPPGSCPGAGADAAGVAPGAVPQGRSLPLLQPAHSFQYSPSPDPISFSQQHGTFEEIITRRAAALAPFWLAPYPSGPAGSLEVRGRIVRSNLLAVAVSAAVRRVNLPSTVGHSRFRHRIRVISSSSTCGSRCPIW